MIGDSDNIALTSRTQTRLDARKEYFGTTLDARPRVISLWPFLSCVEKYTSMDPTPSAQDDLQYFLFLDSLNAV